MSNPQSRLIRRIDQFAAHLARLRDRFHARAKDPYCYTIISELRWKPERQPLPPGAEVLDPALLGTNKARAGDWHRSDMWSRYVQFGYHGDWFYLELPHSTISPDEGLRLVAERPGFFFLKDRPESPSAFSRSAWKKLVQEHNPIHRVYAAAEIPAAAADTAYIWFQLWCLPTEWVFYCRSAYFEGEHALEDDLPLG